MQSRAEQWQIDMTLDASQPGFDVHESGGQPAVSLPGGGPSFNVAGQLSHLTVDQFDAVGGPEAQSEEGHLAEAVQGEGLFHDFDQAFRGRRVHGRAFPLYRLEVRSGFVAGVPLVGALQLAHHAPLFGLGEIAQDVLPFVPLAVLDHDLAGEDPLHSV